MGGRWNKWVRTKQAGCYLAANPSTAVAVHQPSCYVCGAIVQELKTGKPAWQLPVKW